VFHWVNCEGLNKSGFCFANCSSYPENIQPITKRDNY
jgi:hypothetical protein